MKKRIIVTLFILVGLSAIPLIIGIFYLYTEAEKVQRSIFVNEVLTAGNEVVNRIDATIKNDTTALIGIEAASLDQNEIDTTNVISIQQIRRFLIDSVNNQPIGVIKSTIYFQENNSQIIANDTEFFTAAFRRLFPLYNEPWAPKNPQNGISNAFNIKDKNLIQLDSATVSDYVKGEWEIKNHPAYYTFAAQYRGRMASYFFSITTPYTLSNELLYDFRFSELDTLAPTRYTREIKVPAMLATGVNYRFNKRHNVMVDVAWRAWDRDVENVAGSWGMAEITKTQNDFNISLGYQRDGSDVFYDAYWDRITYRAGFWFKNWYVEDVSEIGGSIGAGLPLGRKGMMLDLAIQGGVRLTDDDRNWSEGFFGIRLGLVGVGSWGKTRGQ